MTAPSHFFTLFSDDERLLSTLFHRSLTHRIQRGENGGLLGVATREVEEEEEERRGAGALPLARARAALPTTPTGTTSGNPSRGGRLGIP